MSPRLRQLLAVVAVVTISGTVYLVARPEPDATWADIREACPEGRRGVIRCEGRVLCGPNSGRMRTVEVQAGLCPTDAGTVLIPRWPRGAGRDCFEPRGGVDEACEVLAGADGGCTDALCEDDSEEPPQRLAQDRCFCRSTPGMCAWRGNADGGWTPIARGPDGSNVHPGPVTGAACVRSPCGHFAGDEDPRPEECR